MKNIYLALAIATCFTVSNAFAQFEHCESVYQTATRNLQISEASYSSLNVLFDDYCEASGEMKTSAASGGLDAVVKAIPIKLSGSASNSSQRMRNFCKNYSSTRFETAASSTLADTVVVEALRSYNQCIAISNVGVIISQSAPEPLQATFSFSFKNELDYQLQGVQVGRNMECHVKKPDGDLVEAGLGTTLNIDKNYSAFCKRTALVSEDGRQRYYPRTSVTFASNHGAYSAIYAAEEVEDIELASALNTRIGNTEKLVSQLSATVANNYNALSASINNNTSSVQGSVDSLRNALTVKVVKVMRGEHHRYAQPNWVHVGCGDPNAWINSQCAGYERIERTQVFQVSGDRCGYTYIIGSCLNVQ